MELEKDHILFHFFTYTNLNFMIDIFVLSIIFLDNDSLFF